MPETIHICDLDLPPRLVRGQACWQRRVRQALGNSREGDAVDGITISSERISAAGTGVTDVGTALGKEIGAMGDLLAEIRSGWQSDSAAPQFASMMQGYLDEASVLKDALLSHGATLQTTGLKFGEAERDLASGMRGGR